MINAMQHILIIGSVWPEPNSSAAGQRMMQLIELFRSSGWQLTFASTAAKSEHKVDLETLGVEPVSIEMNSSAFDDFIRGLEPSMVMFDRFMIEEQFGWRVAEQCPDAVRILDTEDLHCLRRARGKALVQGRSFTKTDLLKEDDAKREIASILRCDINLVISEYEMRLLQELFAVEGRLLHYLPFLLDPVDDAVAELWPCFEDRKYFMTIGNFRHAPNMDAVEYLSEHIWPLIRRHLPKAQLHVYGSYPSSRARKLHHPEAGFYIKGRVESAQEVMLKARVCLAPLRFGAGLKGKLIEAMQYGTPSVTTSIGSEGITGGMEWPGIIANTPEKLAAAAVKLYTNQAAWEEAQKAGKCIINKRFAKKEFGPALIHQITKIQQGLEQHRLNNFTGAMLMHHTTASTKYMARWIEAKNRP